MSRTGKPIPKIWIVAAIIVVLIVNYIAILHVEIIEEVRPGRPAIEAVLQGDVFLTLTGIAISVTGVAWILRLLLGRKSDQDSGGG